MGRCDWRQVKPVASILSRAQHFGVPGLTLSMPVKSGVKPPHSKTCVACSGAYHGAIRPHVDFSSLAAWAIVRSVNFFEYQEDARRRTSLLVAYYAVAVALIILALYVVVAAILQYGLQSDTAGAQGLAALWNPVLFGWVALITGGLILAGTLYKMAALSSGGDTVAAMLGGRLVPTNTRDPAERRLLNVVEEMAIAAGTPIPRVYVLNDEEGINAFAAGLSPSNAVVAVTRGGIRRLTRDELQGVIAHEFSHILNGDMRLNLRLIGVLNGILLIALVGYGVFRGLTRGRVRMRSDKKGGGGAVIVAILAIALAMIVIGYIGVFFARLIKSAVSRQREFLADASAVQFTRNPDGIAGALKKIGGLFQGSRVESPHAEEASHLFFADGLKSSFLSLMATHPPLVERIRRLDPSFEGKFDRRGSGQEPSDEEVVAAAMDEEPAAFRRAAAPETIPVPPPLPSVNVEPARVVEQVGTLGRGHLTYAASLLSSLPAGLRESVRDPMSAQAVVFGLLLSKTPDIRDRQMNLLSTNARPAMHRETLRILPLVKNVGAEARLPLAELALGTLGHMSAPQYRTFRDLAVQLAGADAEIDLFEYVLLRIMTRHLDPLFGLGKRRTVRYSGLAPLADECSTLLSAIAWFGQDTPEAAAAAFRKGADELGVSPGLALLAGSKASLESMDTALEKLADADPASKQKLVAACAACVGFDGKVTVEEAEALRAVADALECPIPPFIDTAAAA